MNYRPFEMAPAPPLPALSGIILPMSDIQQFRTAPVQKGLQAAPAVVLGLYAGRIAAELARSGLMVALILTVAALISCAC